MRRLLAGLIVASAALDIASYYYLAQHGAGELNPVVLTLGPAAIIAKLVLAGALILALKREARYALPVGAVAALAWSFGAVVNSL